MRNTKRNFWRRSLFCFLLLVFGILMFIYGGPLGKVFGGVFAFIGFMMFFINIGDSIGKWAGFHHGKYH